MIQYKKIAAALALSIVCTIQLPITVLAQHTKDTVVVANNQLVEPNFLLQVSKDKSIQPSATVSGSALVKTPVANLTNTLYGLLPGLIVRQRSGEPGYDDALLSIRGRATYDQSGLIIYVDGFQTTSGYFSYLSPEEIESITVLKDPVSLATIGMRGANGVLWVITKRGQSGKQKVKAQVISGIQQPISLNKPLGSYDFARLYNHAISNDGYALNGYNFNMTPKYSEQQLETFKNGNILNVDWYNENLRKNGFYTNANIELSGGDQSAKYAVILDYMKQSGLYNVPTDATKSNAQIQRFNIRTNLDFNFFKIFEAKVDIGGRIEERRYPNYNGNTLWNNMARYPSLVYTVRDSATKYWSGTTLNPDNPVASLNALGWRSTQDRTLQANFSVKQKLDFITQGLYLNEAVSFNTFTRTSTSKTATYARYFKGIKTTNDNNSDIIANGSTPEDQYDWKQMNLTAGYDHRFGRHSVSAAVNYFASAFITDQDNNTQGLNAGNNIFYNYLNIGARLQYAYNDTYLAEVGVGKSSSDNFAPDKRSVLYPSIGAGWIVSKMDFLKQNLLVKYLKIRGSAGLSGFDQSNLGRYLFQQYYISNGSYLTGNTSLTTNGGLIQAYAANPAIGPEKSLKYNVGFDANILNHVSITFDVFQDKRTNIITQTNSLMGIYGGIAPFKNLGEVTNKGYELSLNYGGKIGNLKYSLTGMIAHFDNKIINQSEVPPINGFSKTTGLPIGTMMGLVADRFYDVTDFNANGTLKTGIATPSFGAVQPGDIKYMDLDNNGRVDQNDVTNIGRPDYPSTTYSFNAAAQYNGFDFTILFQGVSGNNVNILTAANLQTVAFVNNTNIFPIAQNAWAYYPNQGIDNRATADYPRLTTLANDNNYRNSSFWVKDGSYLRVRNAELGYTMPKSVLTRLKVDHLRVFINAVNPLSWSVLQKKYAIDPETTSGYPALKSLNTGITLNF